MGITVGIKKLNSINFFLVLFIIFTLSCKTKKQPFIQSQEDFLQAYKTSVFYGCLNEATNGNFSEFSKKNNDLRLAPQVAVINNTETEKAATLGAKMSKNIKPSEYGDYEGRAPFFSSCVDYAFFSKDIDSIAREAYKHLVNGKMEYNYE